MSPAAFQARLWLEEHWVRPHPWSLAMCRWPHLVRRSGIRLFEVEEVTALSFRSWQEERGVLF